MGTDKGVQLKRGHVVFVGSKGSGKSSLYQCLRTTNPQVMEGPGCFVLVEDWQPFNMDYCSFAEECREYFNENLSEEDMDATLTVWDICGHEVLWSIQQLCLPQTALYVLVFNVRNPRDAKIVPQWVQMIHCKSPGAEIIIAASHCEVSEDPGQNILDEIKKLDGDMLTDINKELAGLRDLEPNIWVKNRIEKLEGIVEKRPNICSEVFPTSAVTGKGISDLRRVILTHFFGAEKFPNIQKNLNEQELKLFKKVRPLHDGKGIVMSGQDYNTFTSELGFHDDVELQTVTQGLIDKGLLSQVKIAGTFRDPNQTLIITDPCCFANACAMIHRDENPQEFVNKLQRSTLVKRFWPTSTRPNDWTLRSAIEDVISRGMIRESFLPLCWQVWNMNEDDIKQLLPAMLQLGVLVDGAPKAGYEIELALSYFKNLSVTKRYHLPLLLKLPAEPPSDVWPKSSQSSTVTVEWQYKFQEGFCDDLVYCILSASKNFKPSKTIISYWQHGLIVRIADVDVMMVSRDCLYQLSARCKITNGNRQALNMAWATLGQFINITECYLSNFPGLYYQFGSPSIMNTANIHKLISNHTTENSSENSWLLPPLGFQKEGELSPLSDLLSWSQSLLEMSVVCICYNESCEQEAQVLGSSLEKNGFDVLLKSSSQLAASDEKCALQRCSAVVILLTKSFIEDPKIKDNIQVIESQNKPLIGACLEANLRCTIPNITDLSAGTGSGTSLILNSQQLQSLISKCRCLIYGTGNIERPCEELSEPSSNSSSESWPVVSFAPAMESCPKKTTEQPKKKHHVQFAADHMTDHVISEDDQIKPLAACTVAAAMVGAAAEHLNQTRKTSSAGMRAANATAKVARAVAHGDANAATEALNDVVKIVDGLSNTLKETGYGAPQKSKTCTIL